MEERLLSAKTLIDNREFDKAIKLLGQCAKEDSNSGMIPFLLGQISLEYDDYEMAYNYFKKSEQLNFENPDLFFWIGKLENELGNTKETEKYYLKSLSLNPQEKSIIIESLVIFYMQHSMYLKAEKYIKLLRSEKPKQYISYHYQIQCELLRGRINEAFSYIEKVPKEFKKSSLYLSDKLEVIEKNGNLSLIINEIDNNDEYMKKIPRTALKKKFNSILNTSEDKHKLVEILKELSINYNDEDAILSTIILLFSNREYMKAAELCEYIMEKELDFQGIRFYIALYYQMYCLFLSTSNKPSKELVEWIEKAGNLCLDYFGSLANNEIFVTINDSIETLFEIINSLAQKS